MSLIRRLSVLVTLAIVCGAPVSWSQDGRDELKRTVERRFEVLPLREGVALRPKAPIAGIRSIEIAGGMIGIDGQPATGAELRTKLGADADALLQLSYMSDAARQSLFAAAPTGAAPSVPVPPVSPAPTAPEIAPSTPPDSPDVRTRPRRSSRGDRRNGDRVRIGGDVTVEEGEVVDGDVVAVGGKVRIDGEVRGNVVAVGGGVTLGPRAIVEDNVTAVGGLLHREPGAQVNGKAQEIALGGFNFDGWTWRRNPVGVWWGSALGSAFAVVGTLVRVAVLCLFAALVVLFVRAPMDRVAAVATTDWLKAGAIGFAAQVLFLPLLVITCVVLVMTIIGIPLLLVLPFVILGLAVAGLVGFSGVANRLGAFVLDRLGHHDTNPYTVTIVGVLVVMAPVLLSRVAGLGGGLMFPFAMALGIVGAILEYVVWTVGFGAIALMRFRRRSDGRTGVSGPTDEMATSSPSA